MDDTYIAFCFDEAVEYIIEQFDKEKGKWKTKPKWTDEEKPKDNSKLIEYMKSTL